MSLAPDQRPIPPGLRIEPSYATGPLGAPLWLPPRLKRRILVPETAHTQKVIYFKGRVFAGPDRRWYGDVLRCHYNVDLDEPGGDGVSVHDQIHLWLTGTLERVSGGAWVYQGSDERWSTTLIEEWPEHQHNELRWSRFWRRER